MRVLKTVLRKLGVALLLLPFTAWGVGAFAWGSWPHAIQVPMATLYGLAVLAAVLACRSGRALLVGFGLFLIPLAAFFLMRPSNDRPWQADVAELPYAEVNGDTVTVHNIRNCDYRSETNFTVRYETRSYELSKLRSVDLLLSDWGLGDVAHTLISFGFDGDRYLCFSIETRKEEGEEYSALKGFFRQYEALCVAADERDVVRLRTNYRQGETVYLYRLRPRSMDRMRGFFMRYVDVINGLQTRPVWYNALTVNCMTSVFRLARANAGPGRAEWHWSVVLNGHFPEHAYDLGLIDTSLPFSELKSRSRINEAARAADDADDFSVRIRAGLPGMDWTPP